jgi:hypothetical protein
MSCVSLLLALVTLPAADAATDACCKSRVISVSGGTDSNFSTWSAQVIVPEGGTAVANVVAEVDGASVPFAETDAWLHGTAALAKAPAEGATLTLTVYDDTSAPLATATGTWTGGKYDGAFIGGETTCDMKAGCGSSGEPDLDLLALRAYPDGTVGIDLAGADVFGVAWAKLVSTESATEAYCVASGKAGCEKWAYTTTTNEQGAEVDWQDAGAVWESDAMDLGEVSKVSLVTWDADGRKIDKDKFDMGPAWIDGGFGVHAMPLDGDADTSLALISDEFHNGGQMAFTVVSDGWSTDNAPALAEVTIDNGARWSVPAHSYQVTTSGPVTLRIVRANEAWYVSSTEKVAYAYHVGASDKSGNATMTVTAWSTSPTALPSSGSVTLDGVTAKYTFSPVVAAVFAMAVTPATDGHGLPVGGEVALLGAADRKGKRKTLAKGDFFGVIGTDGDGDLDLAAAPPDRATAARGDILIGTDPIGFEKDAVTGAPTLPPAIIAESNGSGTRNIATTTSAKPDLL